MIDARSARHPGVHTFAWLCAAQIISLTGSQLTSFGLGVFVYQRTASTTAYAWTVLCIVVPGIVASPFAGMLVDRSVRGALLGGHAAAGLCSAMLALLVRFDALRLQLVLPVVALASICNAVHAPALSAAIPRLVPRGLLARANGVLELGLSVGSVAAPAAAAAILAAGGIWYILVIDAITFLLAVAIVFFVRVPRAPAAESSERPHLWKGARDGWRSGASIHRVNVVSSYLHGVLAELRTLPY